MGGRLFLGNQMVTPVIVKGSGIDTSKYEQLPYIIMWENDYIELGTGVSTSQIKLEYITNEAVSETMYACDVVECNKVESSYTNGWDCILNGQYTAYLSAKDVRLKGPCVATKEFVLDDNKYIRTFKSADKITISGDLYVTNNGTNTFSFVDSIINLNGVVNNSNYLQDIIFDNCLLNVTSDTNGKEIWITSLKGSLGFYVEPTDSTVFPLTLSIRATTVDSGFTFIDNDLYNATITTREEGGYIYKDISISPKTKQEVLALGYTESEYNLIKSVENEGSLQDELYCSKIRYDSSLGYVNRVHGEAHYLINKSYRLAQEGKTSKARSLISNKITGYTGRLVRAGSYCAAKRLSDNAEGVVDMESGEFYPLVKLPITLTINVMVQEGDLTTHLPETPVTCSYIVDGEPVQETGTTLQVFPGSSISYTVTETVDDWKEFSTASGTVSNMESDTTVSVTLKTSRKIFLPALGEGGYAYWTLSSYTSETFTDGYVIISPTVGTGYSIHAGKTTSDGYYYAEKTVSITEQNGYVQYTSGGIIYRGTFTGSLATLQNLEPNKYVLVTFDGFPTDGSLKGTLARKETVDARDRYVQTIGEGMTGFPDVQKNQVYINYGWYIEDIKAFRYSENGKAYLPCGIYNDKESSLQITEPNTVVPFTPVIKSFTETTDYVRPDLTASGTLWEDPLAVSGPAYSATYSDWKAFDNSTSTYYRTASYNNELYITFNKPVELTQLQFTCNSTSTAPTSITVSGLVKNQDNTVSSYTLIYKSNSSATFTIYLLKSAQGIVGQSYCYAGPYQGYRIYLGRSSGTVYLKNLGLVGKNVTEDT